MGRGPKSFGGTSKSLVGWDLSAFARTKLTPADQVKTYDAAGHLIKVTTRKQVIAKQSRQRDKTNAAFQKKSIGARVCNTTHAFFKRSKVEKQMKTDENSVALANFDAAMTRQKFKGKRK